MIHIKNECKRCKSKKLIDFREINIVEDMAYIRTECKECGYWEIENHKGYLVRTSESVMRDATREELEGVGNYIKSISKPTGVNFFDEFEDAKMTEKKLDIINEHICIGVSEPFIINDINCECTEYPMEQVIKVGDMVNDTVNVDMHGVVIDEISDEEVYVFTDNGCIEKWDKGHLIKTGKSIDIETFRKLVETN